MSRGPAACLLALISGCAVHGAAHAQHDAVDRCRAAATAERRIACLEAALLENERVSADDVPGAQRADPDDMESPPVPAAPVPTVQDEPAAHPAARDIGAEQVRARSDTRADIEARLASASGLRVAGYTQVPYQRLQVELENGQIWRQVEGDTQRFKVDLARNQTVDISESRIGGYKLRLNEMRRTISVERVR